MKSNRSLVVSLFALLTSLSFAGNERGGGVPPAPIFMPEAVTYQCQIKHMQMSLEKNGAIVSRTTQVLSWKKDEYAGNRIADLSKIRNWKHYEFKKLGPFLPSEVETTVLPSDLSFGGSVILSVSLNEKATAENRLLDIHLETSVSSVEVKTKTLNLAKSSDFELLQSRNNIASHARLESYSEYGDLKDQRVVDVTCQRVL